MIDFVEIYSSATLTLNILKETVDVCVDVAYSSSPGGLTVW